MVGKRRSGLFAHRKAYSWAKVTPSIPPVTYTVTYNGNTKTSGNVPIDGSSPYNAGSSVTILGNSGTLIKTDYIFSGWNTAANGSGTSYSEGDTFTINANTILYAKWLDAAPPSTPTSLSSVGGNQAAYILFTQTGNVTNYQYSTDNGATYLAFDPPQIYSPVEINTLSSDPDRTIRLTNGTEYTVKLKAVNSAGASNESASVTVTPTVTSLTSAGRIIYLDANNSSSYSGSGTTWTNLDSAGSYSATLTGSPPFNTTDAGNKYFDFNRAAATGQFAEIIENAAINPVLNQPFTIQMWVRINNVGSQGNLFNKMFIGTNDYDGYNLMYSTDDKLRLHLNGRTQDNAIYSVAGVLSSGWRLYTANIQFGNGSGRTNKLFVNGRQVLTATSTETIVGTATKNITFPAGFGGDGECDVGQFYYYNTELTTTQIIQNYDASKLRYIA